MDPALEAATPDGLRVLDASSATDQDTDVVTREFSEEYGITSVADLASAPAPVTLGGPAEGRIRPIGPAGPVTVQALQDGVIDLAVLSTASPIVADDSLVQLEDPAGLLLTSHVVPVASDRIDGAPRR